MFVLTVCKLEREADFRGGVFLGLNALPNKGILMNSLTCQPALSETHKSFQCYSRNNLSMFCVLLNALIISQTYYQYSDKQTLIKTFSYRQ